MSITSIICPVGWVFHQKVLKKSNEAGNFVSRAKPAKNCFHLRKPRSPSVRAIFYPWPGAAGGHHPCLFLYRGFPQSAAPTLTPGVVNSGRIRAVRLSQLVLTPCPLFRVKPFFDYPIQHRRNSIRRYGLGMFLRCASCPYVIWQSSLGVLDFFGAVHANAL